MLSGEEYQPSQQVGLPRGLLQSGEEEAAYGLVISSLGAVSQHLFVDLANYFLIDGCRINLYTNVVVPPPIYPIIGYRAKVPLAML